MIGILAHEGLPSLMVEVIGWHWLSPMADCDSRDVSNCEWLVMCSRSDSAEHEVLEDPISSIMVDSTNSETLHH